MRYTYDNNYFNDLYQGIPIGGYNVIIDRLFEGCDIETGVDYLEKEGILRWFRGKDRVYRNH